MRMRDGQGYLDTRGRPHRLREEGGDLGERYVRESRGRLHNRCAPRT